MGLKRDRSVVFYSGRSLLSSLKHGEEEKNNNTLERRVSPSLSISLSPSSLSSLFLSISPPPLPSLLSCLIAHFSSPSAGAPIEEQTLVSPQSCYTSISVPASSLSFSSSVFTRSLPALFSASASGRGRRCRETPTFLPITRSVAFDGR